MLGINQSGSLLKICSLAAVVTVAGCATATSKPEQAAAPEPAEPATKTVLKEKVLDARTTFAFDSAELTSEGEAALDNLVAESGGSGAGRITITGHTDRIGPAEYNQGLSERRANSVAEYMMQQGIAEGAISASGKGESEPVVTCEDQPWDALVECLQPNRRVEVSYPVAVEEEVMMEEEEMMEE